VTIELSTGSIFDSGCEALVSPVSCDAAQGAGLALAFTKRFPAQTRWYREHGRKGLAEPGQVYHVLPKNGGDRLSAARWVLSNARCCSVPGDALNGEPLVLFATTKLHWKRPSELRWIIGCLAELVEVVEALGIRSTAVPMLGCGLGGLAPEVVRPQIVAAADRMRCRVWIGEAR
jgi:O-acetyl-ADP-ribose deacetylase (regulator of RNase III)